jgi:hypothetical protein
MSCHPKIRSFDTGLMMDREKSEFMMVKETVLGYESSVSHVRLDCPHPVTKPAEATTFDSLKITWSPNSLEGTFHHLQLHISAFSPDSTAIAQRWVPKYPATSGCWRSSRRARKVWEQVCHMKVLDMDNLTDKPQRHAHMVLKTETTFS